MSATLLPGYRMRRLIHRGRSFAVYDAWSVQRACPVVVKVARPSASTDAARRLLSEGRALQRLSHPYLVRAYEVRRAPRPAVVLETLSGETLAHLFGRRGPLPVRDVVELGRQVSSVLGYLHRSGLVHCDLKPANAVVDAGRVRLIDLSLARRPGPYRTDAGTPGYLAPEQSRRGEVGPSTDVWGLGLLLLEAASGEDPFPVGCAGYDENRGPLRSPVPLSSRRRVPRQLSGLVAACTAYDPARRPTVPEVAAALDRLLD
jgi:serine/threonine protein kinase